MLAAEQRSNARRHWTWLLGIASAVLIVGTVLMQSRQPTGGEASQRTEGLLIRFDQDILPDSEPSARKLRQKMVHDMESATASLAQLVAKTSDAESRATHVEHDWPLVMKWTFAPDQRPTQLNSTVVASEADVHVAAVKAHETSGEWTAPCHTWPFRWPFSPCKEPPGQTTAAPSYEIIVNIFRGGTPPPTHPASDVPSFQGACVGCLGDLPPVTFVIPATPTPSRAPTPAPSRAPTPAPVTAEPTFTPNAVKVDISWPTAQPTRAPSGSPSNATMSPTASPSAATAAPNPPTHTPTRFPDTITIDVNEFESGAPPGAVSERIIIPQPMNGTNASSVAEAISAVEDSSFEAAVAKAVSSASSAVVSSVHRALLGER